MDFGSRMVAAKNAPRHSRIGKALRREGIRATAEFRRIAALPRRKLQGSIDVEGLSAMLRLHPPQCKGCKLCIAGKMTLFPDQAYGIKEIHDVGGGFIGMEVGSGKSLTYMLAAKAVGSKRPLILLPAATREQVLDETIPAMGRHWQIPSNLMIGSYESLGTGKGKDFLRDRMPDWVFADEAQWLMGEDSARSIRFFRHYDEYPATRLAAFSGSFFDRSIKRFAPIIRLCLAHYCPLPFDDDELEEWGLAVDSKVDPESRFAPGALLEFAEYLTSDERRAAKTELGLARLSLGARMAETPGVVFSTAQTVNIPITVKEHHVKNIPDAVTDAFEILRETWETPRGDVITDAIHLYRIVKQLAQGFFYRWVWPKDPITGKEVPNLIWLDARKAWHRFVRGVISRRTSMQLDSYKEVENCCARYERWLMAKQMGIKDVEQELRGSQMIDSQEWRNWLMVRGQYDPVTEVVWLPGCEAGYLVKQVAEWLDGPVPGIAWVENQAMGDALRKQGYRYYRGGEDEIIYETVSCVAAIKAHSFGKNLQHFHRGLVVIPPTKGKDWEQLIGRYHRSGQQAARVEWEVCLHVRELWSGFWQACRDAEFAQDGSRSAQRLCLADIQLETSEVDFPMRCLGDDPLWKFSKAA